MKITEIYAHSFDYKHSDKISKLVIIRLKVIELMILAFSLIFMSIRLVIHFIHVFGQIIIIIIIPCECFPPALADGISLVSE